MDITIHVPVPSFVFKYCAAVLKEKNKPFTAWRLTLHPKEGKTIYAMLERMQNRYEKYRKNECTLQILIPSDLARKKGCYLSQESIDLFVDYIKQVIMDEILQYHTGIRSGIGLKAIDKITINQYLADKHVRVLRVTGSEAHKFYWQKSIILDILAKYDITEDEISCESVVKHLQRHGTIQVSA